MGRRLRNNARRIGRVVDREQAEVVVDTFDDSQELADPVQV